ncbi:MULTISPECIES: STAS domain-containing protein [Allobranchiibius]|uniref:Anti-sigma factor antagonist n=1 Tax=Allobranchiibius huperziae TaxID=1874116 RepID=A0A853DEB9_9MICO|nr:MULTISPECIES: STAS domain-containing protein [Allobranchiibius]MBO1766124.1 STAS domain-containing protein [Allobranchiibius sp. GilTou38]NYJ73414.1 anti-sigma B factor antagonist [Allobranchiibius huperziae]
MQVSVLGSPETDPLVLNVQGDLDATTSPVLRAELARLMAARNARVVLDLRGVPFLDSTGLGVLVGRLRSIRLAGGDLVLVIDNERVLRNFAITGLNKVFQIFSSRDEALTTLG